MTCLEKHQVRLVNGRVYVWFDHVSPDAQVVQILEAYVSGRMLARLRATALLTHTGREEDVDAVRQLLNKGVGIWMSAPYKALTQAYHQMGIVWPRREPGESDEQFARRVPILCSAEAPFIRDYFAQCAPGNLALWTP